MLIKILRTRYHFGGFDLVIVLVLEHDFLSETPSITLHQFNSILLGPHNNIPQNRLSIDTRRFITMPHVRGYLKPTDWDRTRGPYC